MRLDPDDTAQADLHGGISPWRKTPGIERPRALECDITCDVLIVGAGITGALVAEHLTRRGHQVVVADRERPGYGSTVVSTALLQWEIDSPLSKLTALYGFDKAADIYRRSIAAVTGLRDLIAASGIDCAFRERSSVYLAGDALDARGLLSEHDLRARADLPGHYLDHAVLLDEFALHREAALVSPGSGEADPSLLTQALLSIARQRGATFYDADIDRYETTGRTAIARCAHGHTIEARHIVLATGYVMPDFLQSDLHTIASSFAIATPPQRPEQLWRERSLIWEASNTYLYARTTSDNRIIFGGEDEPVVEPHDRDAMMAQKAKTLLKKLAALWPQADTAADFVWSGAFGSTVDGLPLIGAVPGYPHLFTAYGYGGNGITFSFLASRIIAELIAGQSKPWFDDFAIDRAPGLVTA